MKKIKAFLKFVRDIFIHIFIQNEPKYLVDAQTFEEFLEWRKNNDK